jgi:hypothetical protein
MPVILATEEEEIRRIWFETVSWKKQNKTKHHHTQKRVLVEWLRM